MIETELKIQLSPEGEAELRRALARAPQRDGPVRTRSLRSIYHDTAGFDLAEAGIALRLRKVGRGWVQTAKQRPTEGTRGLFAATELARPAPGGRLQLDGGEPAAVLEAVRKAADGAELGPVFETRVRRTAARLQTEAGAVEVAIDRGEVIAGALSAPIREAEFELLDGEVGAIFEAAAALLRSGPLRFSTEPKSARGLRLARQGRADPAPRPRKAGTIAYSSNVTAEEALRAVLRDCFAQIAANLVLTAESEDPEAPHQLRIGLRRLRTALASGREALGPEAALAEEAKRIGREAGRLRDLDVLIGEMLAGAGARGLEPELQAAFAGALEERRRAARAAVREALAGGETVRFLLDLAAFIEGGGRMARPEAGGVTIGAFARPVLHKRYRKVVKRGRRLETLDVAGLHDLRKELKKLRYSIELLAPLHGGKARRKFLKRLKALQKSFGAVNDADSARDLLDPPVDADWRLQRASGWMLGALAMEAEAARAGLGKRWKAFARLEPFWR